MYQFRSLEQRIRGALHRGRLRVALGVLFAGCLCAAYADDDQLLREQALYDQRSAELERRCDSALAANLSPGELNTYRSLDEEGQSGMLEDGLSTGMYEVLAPACQETAVGSLFMRALLGPDTVENAKVGVQWFMTLMLRVQIDQLSYPAIHANQPPGSSSAGVLTMIFRQRWGGRLKGHEDLMRAGVQFALDWDRMHPSVLSPPDEYPVAHAEARASLTSALEPLAH